MIVFGFIMPLENRLKGYIIIDRGLWLSSVNKTQKQSWSHESGKLHPKYFHEFQQASEEDCQNDTIACLPPTLCCYNMLYITEPIISSYLAQLWMFNITLDHCIIYTKKLVFISYAVQKLDIGYYTDTIYSQNCSCL